MPGANSQRQLADVHRSACRRPTARVDERAGVRDHRDAHAPASRSAAIQTCRGMWNRGAAAGSGSVTTGVVVADRSVRNEPWAELVLPGTSTGRGPPASAAGRHWYLIPELDQVGRGASAGRAGLAAVARAVLPRSWLRRRWTSLRIAKVKTDDYKRNRQYFSGGAPASTCPRSTWEHNVARNTPPGPGIRWLAARTCRSCTSPGSTS
ncbi:hypothetical protein HBB16_21205 [Pseudonocardia sp. MCCB 268]|nr:hypothetical protein [Pseudonocardia cytotoxica]